jgi:hypothetical protein
MELFGRQLQARHRLLRPRAVGTVRTGFPCYAIVHQELLAILAAAVFVIFGPEVLLTIARTSVVWIQIVLGLCRTCFPLFRILGV